MSIISEQIDARDLDAFMMGIARRKYHLLLGAGASSGARSRNGKPLPMGSNLTSEIGREFGMPSHPSLKRMYSLAKPRRGKSNQSIDEYISQRFTECEPPLWMENLVKIAWDHIWNLNVDDCVSRAYGKYREIKVQDLLSKSWTEPNTEPDRVRRRVLDVHLHGKASRSHKGEELVFDIAQYINANNAERPWHKKFADAYQANPFLIVGASLNEEIDIQEVLNRGRYQSEVPSIIVSKYIDEFEREEFKSYGLIPIVAEADEFFAELVSRLPRYRQAIEITESIDTGNVSSEARVFFDQWEHRSLDHSQIRDDRHDVFKGHEPRWGDAVTGKIMERDVVKEIYEIVTGDPSDDIGKNIALLFGAGFSGKSSALLSLEKRLCVEGFDVYRFKGNSSIDNDSVRWWIEQNPRSVFVIDDAADFAVELSGLLRECKSDICKPRMVLASRDARSLHIINTLNFRSIKQFRLPDNASAGEIERLISLLEDERRLGILRNTSSSERRKYFSDSRSSLFSVMADLEFGRGFESRILGEYDTYKDKGAPFNILGVAALSAYLGHDVPKEVMGSASNVSVLEIEKLLDEDLGDIVKKDSESIGLRHRYMGSLLIANEFTIEQKYELARSLAMVISPHYSRDSIRPNTVYHRIARSLMTRDTLLDMFDKDNLRVLRWYEDVQDHFDWNARFWEQRALVAVEINDFERALSWAYEALSRYRDPFTLHTVGVVLMKRALSDLGSGEAVWDAYELAEQFLRDARSREYSPEYPYQTFFEHTLQLAKGYGRMSEEKVNWLDTLWSEWYRSILYLADDHQERIFKTAKKANLEWEKVFIK